MIESSPLSASLRNTRWLRQCVWSVKPYGIKVSFWGSGSLGIVIYGNPLVHKVGQCTEPRFLHQ